MTKLDSQQEKYVSTIETCSNLLLMLIEDVLHFSQLGLAEREMKVERKPFALEPCFKIIEEVVRPYASQFEVEVKKEVDILSFPPMVLGDPTHFKRVVLALLTNAIKVQKFETNTHTLQSLQYLIIKGFPERQTSQTMH